MTPGVEVLERRQLLVVGVSALPYAAPADSVFNGVAKLFAGNNACSSSLLLGGRQLLTAAHCFGDSASDLELDNVAVHFHVPSGTVIYPIDPSDIWVHPLWNGTYFQPEGGYDWALVTLPSFAPTDAHQYDIYRESDEVGHLMVFAGYGLTGTGDGSIPIGSSDSLRAAYNHFGPDLLCGPRILLSDFDSGDPADDSLGDGVGFPFVEGYADSGDSGGPAFVGDFEIAGITSGKAENDPQNPGLFGNYNAFTRVSAHAAVIDLLTSLPDDIVLDLSKQPAGNDGAPDTIEALLVGAGNDKLRLIVNGETLWTGNVTQVDSLTILGSNDSDTILIHGALPFAVSLDGRAGNDVLDGAAGSELLIGGSGSDILRGRGGDDLLIGGELGAGGQDSGDTQIGGSGNDILIGGIGSDLLQGAGGNDFILGGQDDDVLDGGSGNDTLNGEQGDDDLLGGGGGDFLVGGADNDSIYGGAGNDIIVGGLFSPGTQIEDELGADFIQGGPGSDLIRADSAAALAPDDLGIQGGDDTVLGGDSDDTILGQAGDDLLSGEDGQDSVRGGDGNDLIRGGGENDTLLGDNDNDIILGEAGDDAIKGGAGRDLLIGGRGLDRINGDGDDDILIAGSTSYDADDAALQRILAEWTSSRSYEARILNLTGTPNKTFSDRLNGKVFLQPGTTVIDDDAGDVLTGAAGRDWFLYDPKLDELVDLVIGLEPAK